MRQLIERVFAPPPEPPDPDEAVRRAYEEREREMINRSEEFRTRMAVLQREVREAVDAR